MEVGKAWTAICRKCNIGQCTTEANMPWQNEAEREIQELKKMVNFIMDKTGAPRYLWVMCSMYVVCLLHHLAQPGLNWRTPIEACYGYTPDMSSLLLFSFFQRYYLGAKFLFLVQRRKPEGLLEWLKMLEMS